MKIRLLELCAGYGSQKLALDNLGIDVYSEIAEFDKYASQAYMQLHGETKNYGDIYTIDETKLPYFDMITYSTPCQDFSVAGKGKGGDKGSGTRSSLLWECERIIRAVKPKYLLMENVKNLLSDKHRHNFNEWFKVLEGIGYTNYYKVLNAKDFGIPQNRERIFCVSILGCGQYLFPNSIPLEKRLKDMLEPQVDEKYYLSADKVEKLTTQIKEKEISNTIRCGGGGSLDGKHTWDIVVEPLCAASRGRNPDNPSDRTAGIPTEQMLEINYSGCTNTLTSVQKDNYVVEPQVLTPKRTEYGKQIRKYYESGLISESRHNMTSMEPRTDGISNTLTSVQKDNYVIEPKVIQIGNIVSTGNWDNPQIGRVYDSDGCSPTLNTCGGGGHEPKITEGYRIRKLTPRECWRLMGVKDEQFDRLHDISNTQLYKLAGNSIVVDVLEAIFRNLLIPETAETKGQLSLF